MVGYDSYAWVFTKGTKKGKNLFKFGQPSVPEEKEEKYKGHVKIIPVPAWGNVRCVAS